MTSKEKPNPWKLKYSNEGSVDRDDLFRAVGHALSVWESLEEAFALTFGHFVGAQHIVALRAIGKIESPAARLNVVLEAFRASEDHVRGEYPTFEGLVKEAIKATEVRNAIAHGVGRYVQRLDGAKVGFLTPTLATTRKTTQINRIDQNAIIDARSDVEALKPIFDYALNAEDIDSYRIEFEKLRDAIVALEIPSSKFVIPA